MKKNITFLLGMLFVGVVLSAQEWQQTATTPEGGGVTEIVVRPDNNHIFVTTASYDWPNGDKGGVRRSTDDGDTWENLFDAYNGRTITFGADGNLYASIWPYPAHEGLYRSIDNGDTWDLLTMIASGNNIFSIAVSTSTNPHTIFAGTRKGVWRSTDNGINWAFANTGIPFPLVTWVRDIEVDSSGIVVAATTSGLFSSEDNGETWQQATGAGIENDTITKIVFDYPFDKKNGNTRLIAGSSNGNIYESFEESKYLFATMVAIFGDNEISGLFVFGLKSLNKKMHGISEFPDGTQSSGFNYSTDDGTTWQQNNNGLPGNPTPPISALSGNSTPIDIKLTSGLFQNMNGGAKILRITYDWSSIIGVEDYTTKLSSISNLNQNFPNPFTGITTITFELKSACYTELSIHDQTGKKIMTLISENKKAGIHKLELDADWLEAGVYFCVLKTSYGIQTKKIIKL